MKYIMLKMKVGEVYQDVPIMFPNELIHSEVAESMKHMIMMQDIFDVSVVAAGFCNLSVTSCHGKSETLKMKSRKGDASIITQHDYWHGMMTEDDNEES